MFETAPGSDGDALVERSFARLLLLKTGRMSLTIALNGGSDTRRASREHWMQFARSLGVPYWGCGCRVIVGEAAREKADA